MLAHHGLLFVLLKRSRPTLKWDEVVFSYAEVDFELDENETREAIAALEAEPELSEREQAALDLLRGRLMRPQSVGRSPRAERRERYLGLLAHLLNIRPWECDLLTVAQRTPCWRGLTNTSVTQRRRRATTRQLACVRGLPKARSALMTRAPRTAATEGD